MSAPGYKLPKEVRGTLKTLGELILTEYDHDPILERRFSQLTTRLRTLQPNPRGRRQALDYRRRMRSRSLRTSTPTTISE